MALTSKRPSKGEEVRTQIMQDIVQIKEEFKRLNVQMEAGLWKRLKMKSVEKDKTMASIVNELVEEYVGKSS